MVDESTRSLRSFRLPELIDEFWSRQVVGGVVVQAAGDSRETQNLLELAEGNPCILGVVGWLDLANSSVEEELDALVGSQRGKWLVGIRHQTHDESDPDWLIRPEVLRGLECVAAVGLSFDLLIRPRELPAAQSLAAALPKLKLIVDHVAKPPVNGSRVDEWETGIFSLAAFPNTFCKLSGLVTEAAPLGQWNTALLEPYFLHALSAFGAERCLFGSDWPVCRLAATYSEVIDLAKGALISLTPRQRQEVMFRNAARIYNLDVPIEVPAPPARK